VASDNPSKPSHRHLAYIGVADLLSDVDPATSTVLGEFMAYAPTRWAFTSAIRPIPTRC
jgi:hypothetical protein